MVITNASEYNAAIERFNFIFDALADSPLGDELDELVDAMEAYEHREVERQWSKD